MFSSASSIFGVGLVLLVGLQSAPSHAAMATALTSGREHNCAVTTAGGALCWGLNSYGQLGNGTQTNSNIPTAISGLGNIVTQVATGAFHTCALLADSTVKCWGYNFNGQLGNGNGNNSTTPVSVRGLSGVIAIATGSAHSCAVLANGNVKCWGANGGAQIGDGTVLDRLTPVDVLSLNGVVGIAAGGSHTCALINTGQVKCWGFGSYGQLGNGTTVSSRTRVDVSGINNANAIISGYNHMCAKTVPGGVKCWGQNSYGQLGNGSTANALLPVDASNLSTGVIHLVGTGDSNCAILNSGNAKCWGRNGSGQLGTGDKATKLSPTPVTNLAGTISGITIGDTSACARITDGVQCWGANIYGQQGAGNVLDLPFPQSVVGLFGAAPPQIPVPFSPVTSNTPIYTWKAIPGASSYRLRVNGVITTYSAATANCPDAVGLCTVTSSTLTPGAYAWQVQGFNDYGDGGWSALTQFSL